MTYRVLARRPAQLDTEQPTQMSRQLGGAGGIRPPSQRTALGFSEDYSGGGAHGVGGSPGQYQSSAGQMQLDMPAYEPGSAHRPYVGLREKTERPKPKPLSEGGKKKTHDYPYGPPQERPKSKYY